MALPDPEDVGAAFASRATVGNAGAPELSLGAWEGPLDLLLELARAQRIDLARISVDALAEQFQTFVEDAIARRAVPLPRLAEWLVMAAWLMALRARLLVPATPGEDAAAEREAVGLRRRLADREAAWRLADWLERRPQLGREVFARGTPDPMLAASPATDLTELLRACLKLLELPVRGERIYRPALPPLWRVPDALAQIRAVLPHLGAEGAPLRRLLPPAEGDRMRTSLQRRAALASTLMAGLELSRDGALTLDQEEAFGELHVSAGQPARTSENVDPGVDRDAWSMSGSHDFAPGETAREVRTGR